MTLEELLAQTNLEALTDEELEEALRNIRIRRNNICLARLPKARKATQKKKKDVTTLLDQLTPESFSAEQIALLKSLMEDDECTQQS